MTLIVMDDDLPCIDGPIDGSCQGQATNQFGLVHGQEQRNVPPEEDPRT